MTRRIRVVIAEDSDAMRSTLQTLIGQDARIEVVGLARDGVEAVAMAKALRPDVMTMDAVMPHIDGVQATEQIMAESPVRILIVSSYVDSRQVDLSFRAIAAGALEVVPKPSSSPDQLRPWAQRICNAIVLMAEVPIVRRQRRASVREVKRTVDAMGLVASTGGPPALAHILGALPAELTVPLFVAQHLAEGFADGLVRWLAGRCQIKVIAAVDGTRPRAGHAYLPPDGCHLEVRDGVVRTPRTPDRHVPSGNRLLASLAASYGARAAGIVMTGMGDDGVDGLLSIRAAGGLTFAQSPESCVVYGMPHAAIAAGATTELRSLESLVQEIIGLSGSRKRSPTRQT